MDKVTVLLGTMYEGGGGLIRDSLSYSTILKKSVRIEKIRANRPGAGGLRSEHTIAIGLMSQLSLAEVTGNTPESRQIVFKPGMQTSHSSPLHVIDVPFEGSAAILMLALMPNILFSHLAPKRGAIPIIVPKEGVTLRIRGGTNCIKAPSYATVRDTIIPTFHMLGLAENIKLLPEYEQGWHTDYVKSPGLLSVHVKPLLHPLPAPVLHHRGRLTEIKATFHAPAKYLDLFERILNEDLENYFLQPRPAGSAAVKLTIEKNISSQPGQYHLALNARTVDPPAYLSYDQVYPQKEGFPKHLDKNVSDMLTFFGRTCIRGLFQELRHGNAVDDHVEDILAVYQALSVGKSSIIGNANERKMRELGINMASDGPGSEYELDTKTLHKETNWWVAHEMANVSFESSGDRFGCQGLGIGVPSTSI